MSGGYAFYNTIGGFVNPTHNTVYTFSSTCLTAVNSSVREHETITMYILSGQVCLYMYVTFTEITWFENVCTYYAQYRHADRMTVLLTHIDNGPKAARKLSRHIISRGAFFLLYIIITFIDIRPITLRTRVVGRRPRTWRFRLTLTDIFWTQHLQSKLNKYNLG